MIDPEKAAKAVMKLLFPYDVDLIHKVTGEKFHAGTEAFQYILQQQIEMAIRECDES